MLVVNVVGVLLIGLIVWWFWLYKPAAAIVTGNGIQVIVENGVYTPARLQLPANTPVSVQFLRKDKSPCAAMVLFPALETSAELTVDKLVKVELPAMAKGEYAFTCQMQMYRGTLLVS